MERAKVLHQAARGGVAVALGGIANQAITAAGGVLLARGLPPEIFGLYGILSYVVTFFAFFGDIGFGPAIVQDREAPSAAFLRSAFTAWTAATGLIILAIIVSAPFVVRWYRLDPASGWALVALAGALGVSLFRGMPTQLLQREMRFQTLVPIDLAETAVFMTVAVALAWLGGGIWSFVAAVWTSRLVGAALIWRARPWPIGFGWDPAALRRALPIAGPLRLKDAISLVRMAMNPVMVGSLVGLPAVGYVTWAEGLASLAGFAAGAVNRVALSTFSRLQEDREAVRQTLRESARIGCAWYYPVAMLLIVLAPHIVHWIYSDRWAPAVPVLRLLLLTGMILAPTLVYDYLFISLGRASWVLGFEVATTALNFLLGVPLILKFGVLGYPMTKLLITAAGVVVYLYLGRRLVGEVPLGVVVTPLTVALGALIVTTLGAGLVVRGPWSLAGFGGSVALAAFGTLYIRDRGRWDAAWRLVMHRAPG